MLKKTLENVLTPKESDELISAFDQIGDIIIVRIPDSLLSKKKIIGETLLKEVKIARSVFYQASAVEGDFRTRNLEILAGKDDTKTEYKEFGCKFVVDVENAFFSPRLSTERERIANLIQEGEIMTNMFAGIGMFSIMAAKKKKCIVYSLDINPTASKLCEKNIELNKLRGKIISINGDASEIIKGNFIEKSDRTLMLLPERSDEFLEDAISTTKNNGIIHYYSHIHADKKSDAAKLSEEHFLGVSPVQSEILDSKIVRAVGPRYYQTVVDVKISK
ncbi:MAG: class I SAM-dependent methyltransferase [Nitrosopumilus sp.]|uniref:class I SAM-dependent methyltransferase n=1 Tax=Nitrosopumilus sp. TaxID=2024843 RepID=UPI002930ED67|nr:class I SAM-dependent methyltransferase family protein [Nitrosopumilus sp.]